MRIVAGTLRGRTVNAPDGEGTRPTTDRVREALFSSLYSLRGGFEGAVVLDAFAGSGALGIEALSRGAARAVFYEANAKAASALKRNIERCSLAPEVASVVVRDVFTTPPVNQVPAFDLVFLDPPYSNDANRPLSLARTLADAGALADDAIIVYEHAAADAKTVEPAAKALGLQLKQMRKYGKTGVAILAVGDGPRP